MGVVSENFPDISFIDNCTIDDVQTQMINDYQAKYKELTGKDITLAQADPHRLEMYACSVQIYQAMQYADYSGKMGLLKYSHGDFLDSLAPFRSVKREEATAATTILEFSIDSPLSSVVAIPVGTRATNGNDIYFATDEYAEIPIGELSVSVPATCMTTGTGGNGFAPGEISTLVNTLAYVSSVANTVTTYGGADIEDDDHLKDRIYASPSSYTTTGSEAAYKYHTKKVDSTINDVVVTQPSAGTVAIYFVCEGGVLPSESLIEKVTEYLMDKNVRPLTDYVVVHAPATKQYDVELTYYIDSSNKSRVASIQSDINTAVSIYNTWQTEKIGRDINPSYLIQKVMATGAKRVEVVKPSFTKLDKTTIATLGTVKITYGGLEDD